MAVVLGAGWPRLGAVLTQYFKGCPPGASSLSRTTAFSKTSYETCYSQGFIPAFQVPKTSMPISEPSKFQVLSFQYLKLQIF